MSGNRSVRLGVLLAAAVLAAMAMLFTVGTAAASTTTVNCAPYGNDDLQSAINGNDVINVRGTCFGNFTVPSSGKTIQGTTSGAGINGQGTGTALSIEYGMLGTVTIRNMTFTNGDAYEGGGIYLYGPITLNLTNSTVRLNRADYGGGGIYAGGGSTLNLTGTTVTHNTTGSYGGGIYVLDADLTTTASTISLNDTLLPTPPTPGNGGGGIYVERGDASLTSTKVTSNKVNGYGGGIALIGGSNECSAAASCIAPQGRQVTAVDDPNLSELTVTSSSVDHNSAKFDYGGGIYSASDNGDTSVTVQGSAVSFNNAFGSDGDADGGGIANYAQCGHTSSLLVLGSTFQGNAAKNGAGGAIFNGTGVPCQSVGTALATIAQSGVTTAPNVLNQNTARYGGGLANEQDEGLASMTIQPGVKVTGNKATATGGGVWNSCGSLQSFGANIMLNTPNNVVSVCF